MEVGLNIPKSNVDKRLMMAEKDLRTNSIVAIEMWYKTQDSTLR